MTMRPHGWKSHVSQLDWTRGSRMSDPVRGHRLSSGTRPRGSIVLVVEEEDEVREMYAVQLAAAGFMVLEAPDGPTAVEEALQFVPHAIVLDLVLPGIDGLKVVRRLRADERTREVAIVAFAAPNASDGTSGSGLGTLAIAAGCDSFFSKPAAPTMITREVLLLVARQARSVAGRRVM